MSTDISASTSPDHQAHRLGTRTRAAATAGGILLGGGGATLLALVVRGLFLGETWSDATAVGAIATVALIGGCQLLYIGVTGRLRGRVNRWLGALWQSLVRAMP